MLRIKEQKTEIINQTKDSSTLLSSLVLWKLWDLSTSKNPYTRGLGEDGFQALKLMKTRMIHGGHCICGLRTNGFHLIHQSAPPGPEWRKQFFAAAVNRNLILPCPEFLHRKSLLIWLLRHRSPVGTLQRQRKWDVFCAVKSVARCSIVANMTHKGKADPLQLSAAIPLETSLCVRGIISGYARGQFLQLSHRNHLLHKTWNLKSSLQWYYWDTPLPLGLI